MWLTSKCHFGLVVICEFYNCVALIQIVLLQTTVRLDQLLQHELIVVLWQTLDQESTATLAGLLSGL